MKLLLDQGNTNLRWVMASATGSLSHAGRCGQGEPLEGALRALREGIGDVGLAGVFVSSVADAARDEALSACVSTIFGLQPVFMTARPESCGVRNGYDQPERLGVDRWLGILGARSICKDAVLVVDAGSAMTLDALQSDGRHLGGFIVPGYAMQCGMLGSGTARVGLAQESAGRGWGRNTATAVSRGVLSGLGALVERSFRELERGVAERCSLVLTGGDAHRIAPWLAVEHVIDDSLLFRGMIAQLSDMR